jgi:hypothetical protein
VPYGPTVYEYQALYGLQNLCLSLAFLTHSFEVWRVIAAPDHIQRDTHTYKHTAGPLSTRDRPVAKNLATHNTYERHPRPQRDSKPQSQQANGRRSSLTPRDHWDRPFPELRMIFLKLCADLLLRETAFLVLNIGTRSLYKPPLLPREQNCWHISQVLSPTKALTKHTSY